MSYRQRVLDLAYTQGHSWPSPIEGAVETTWIGGYEGSEEEISHFLDTIFADESGDEHEGGEHGGDEHEGGSELVEDAEPLIVSTSHRATLQEIKSQVAEWVSRVKLI